MTDKQTLLDLADRVEAGEGKAFLKYEDTPNLVKEIVPALGLSERNTVDYQWICKALFNDGLSAARDLHDKVLPGWEYTLSHRWYPNVELKPLMFHSPTIKAKAGNLAAAWVAAILRAKSEEVS